MKRELSCTQKTAYVWVFVTFREVVYFYSETREGSLVQSVLGEFKGVLVSDFYAAYDSIPCPQQKCLLHLMRDLNDAVLDNPYDEDVKGIVMAFAELLHGIVKTIDRWGLKRRFLRKHLVDVPLSYKRISKTGLASRAASKWKDRFEKDRAKLFTFLSHDRVPWNNNNVEHAIKAFARLRRAIEGLSTPKGIEEYLILLSVCQTCKYPGWTFWIFSVPAKPTSSPSRQANRTDAGTLLSPKSTLAGASLTANWSGTEDPRRRFFSGRWASSSTAEVANTLAPPRSSIVQVHSSRPNSLLESCMAGVGKYLLYLTPTVDARTTSKSVPCYYSCYYFRSIWPLPNPLKHWGFVQIENRC
jgi:hypothetical protein